MAVGAVKPNTNGKELSDSTNKSSIRLIKAMFASDFKVVFFEKTWGIFFRAALLVITGDGQKKNCRCMLLFDVGINEPVLAAPELRGPSPVPAHDVTCNSDKLGMKWAVKQGSRVKSKGRPKSAGPVVT